MAVKSFSYNKNGNSRTGIKCKSLSSLGNIDETKESKPKRRLLQIENQNVKYRLCDLSMQNTSLLKGLAKVYSQLEAALSMFQQ